MSLLYKPREEQTTSVNVVQSKDKISFSFSSDCGKFGTDEMLDSYTFTAKRLLQILQDREDITDEENN